MADGDRCSDRIFILNDGPKRLLVFECPGCGYAHHVDDRWQWNGSLTKPTFSPSVLTNGHDPAHRCHSFVRDGRIEFLSDCWHQLADQTVDLPPHDWD
jgi:hypothetical protein